MFLAKLVGVAAVAAAFSVSTSGVASASYDRLAAARYANKYAYNHNPYYISFTDDCTNFVSQSLRAGGHPYEGVPRAGLLNDNSQWWQYDGASGRTYSWSVAENLGTYLSVTDNGADGGHHQTAPSTASSPPSPVTQGDPVFYIWDVSTQSTYKHSAFINGVSTDPNSGWKGTLVDQHTTDRYWAIWNLRPYNSQWASTSTTEFHIL